MSYLLENNKVRSLTLHLFANRNSALILPVVLLQNDSWRSFFDLIVVDTKKPLFFAEGTVLRQVDTVGKASLTEDVGAAAPGRAFH